LIVGLLYAEQVGMSLIVYAVDSGAATNYSPNWTWVRWVGWMPGDNHQRQSA
jgi:hypothetical protein